MHNPSLSININYLDILQLMGIKNFILSKLILNKDYI